VDFDQLAAHFKRLASTLTPKQIITLALAFVGVVGVVVGSAYYVNVPTYSLLFSDMDAESASSVVAKLKNDKVPYLLDEGGRTIRVASTRVDELRLAFSSASMPSTGRIGFEIFDRTAFGTTEFLEHINYRRALEGELARTIGTIAEVASARVHIAMAKDSLFSGEAQAAKASVVLKLRSNRPPAAATVSGIAGLLAASVESLRPEAVVIVDTFGRSLSKSAEENDEAGGAPPVERQHRIERELTTRVVALLEPVVGSGHVRVNVSARLGGKSEEETEERWDPTTVVRSKQSSSDSGATASAQGVAGARANMPPNVSTAPRTPAPPAAAPTAASRSVEVTNFEVSKLTRHTIAPRGQLARLSVAVILDDDHATTKDAAGKTAVALKPRTAEEMKRIQGLVAAAVGLDAERGDQLTVENIAFEEAPLDEAPPATTGWMQRLTPQGPDGVRSTVMESIRVGVVLLLAVVAFFAILKPMARRALRVSSAQLLSSPALAGGAGGVRTVADMEGEIEAEILAGVAAKAAPRRLPVLTKRIARGVDQQPEHAAKLVRNWLMDEEK
jgi:flagellar M-ring protein FliF